MAQRVSFMAKTTQNATWCWCAVEDQHLPTITKATHEPRTCNSISLRLEARKRGREASESLRLEGELFSAPEVYTICTSVICYLLTAARAHFFRSLTLPPCESDAHRETDGRGRVVLLSKFDKKTMTSLMRLD